MALNKIVNRENVAVLWTREEPSLRIEVYDLKNNVDVMAEIAPEHDVEFMGDIVPEHDGFYIRGFQVVDTYNKCIYRKGIEKYGITEKNWDLECHMCDGHNCQYEPIRKLVMHDDEV